jgi:hypothetical protein
VSHDFFREHVAGELRWVRRGRKKLVSVSELQRWLDERGSSVRGSGVSTVSSTVGVSLTAGFDSALYFLAPAVIALAPLAIANSWILTVVGSQPASQI